MEVIEATQAIDSNFYNGMLENVKENLEKIESRPEFKGLVVIDTVEIALTLLKDGEKITINKKLHQHEWSWLKYVFSWILPIIGPKIYVLIRRNCSTYSQARTIQLIENIFQSIVENNKFSKDQVLSCEVQANLATHSLLAWGRYGYGWKDIPKTIFCYTALGIVTPDNKA